MAVKESSLSIFKPYTQKMISDILSTDNLNVSRRDIGITYSITNYHTSTSNQIVVTIAHTYHQCANPV